MNHDLFEGHRIAPHGAFDEKRQRCLIPYQGVSRQLYFYGQSHV